MRLSAGGRPAAQFSGIYTKVRPNALSRQRSDGNFGFMFLRRLKLINVRSIEELEIDFSAPGDSKHIRKWTLLLAENGTGKTCILRSIGLLLAGGDSLIKLVTDIDGWIRNGARTARMEATIETEKGQPRAIWLEFQRGMSTTAFSRHNAEGIDLLDAALRKAARNYFTVGYGASRRLPGSSLSIGSRVRQGAESFLPVRGQSMASLFSPDAELNSLQNWAMDLDYEHGKTGLAIIDATIASLLPGLIFERIDKKRKQLLFRTADGIVPLGRLSDGYQSMAGWIGDLLFRITQTFADFKDPLNARGLLLLDEMDLHLHPVWQRQLVTFLGDRLPNFQIIATTHSPMTAQQAGPEELHLLERLKPKAAPTLRRFDGTPRLMRLEDLAISPWFGLQTSYSYEIESLREQYVKEKSQGSGKEKRQRKSATKSSAKATLVEKIMRRSPGIGKAGLLKTMTERGRSHAKGVPTAKAALEVLAVQSSVDPIQKQNLELLTRLQAVITAHAEGNGKAVRKSPPKKRPQRVKSD
jgi:predicted ATP-binding protein involved in virulence